MTAAGFTPESFAFLASLGSNNSKDWFNANKEDYQRNIKKPADALRTALVTDLAEVTGCEMASKQFRINRDLRFSKDKTPYNTHVRMAFWPTGGVFAGKDAQPPSFFLSIEADHIRYGTGCMAFSKPVLGAYLQALETGRAGEVIELLQELEKQGFERSQPDLAKLPRGFPKNLPHAELARHKGIAVWATLNETSKLCGSSASAVLLDLWRPTLQFWAWLAALQKET